MIKDQKKKHPKWKHSTELSQHCCSSIPAAHFPWDNIPCIGKAMWKICRALCTCTKELKSTEASSEDPPSLEERTPFLAWAMLTWLFSHRALRAEPSPVAFHSAGGVPRPLITTLKPGGVETSPFHSGIPEERKSLPSEAARLPGCCCHLLPTRSLAAHGSPDLEHARGKAVRKTQE